MQKSKFLNFIILIVVLKLENFNHNAIGCSYTKSERQKIINNNFLKKIVKSRSIFRNI